MESDGPPAGLTGPVTAATAGAGASRARQLRWVASELAVFAAGLPPQDVPGSAAGWLAPDFVGRYLAAADAGLLRRRGAGARPSTDASRRIRRACVRLLAAAAGVPDPVPDAVPLPEPRPRAEDLPAGLALAHWSGQALPTSARPADVRIAAMATLIHAAGLRSGELAALVPADLDLAAGTLTYQPRPPATRVLPPRRTVELRPPAVRVLRHWLEVRAELTARTPRTRSLWVSLAANHDGSGTRRPAGMPLQPTGLRRAYSRAVAAVNVQLAGTPGYEPLPRTAGRLRRPDTEA